MPRTSLRVRVGSVSRDLRNEIHDATAPSLRRTASRIASEMRQGDAKWPVDTGFSRDSFTASDTRIENNADYAPYVHDGEAWARAKDYIRSRVGPVMREQMRKELDG